ncbi:MAG TPA: hypothetical protein VK662_06020 [Acidothermaceae bacterium]|jgi:hypothetical protein|nr:hypothetical protein [Acidothermaceae bacterium]
MAFSLIDVLADPMSAADHLRSSSAVYGVTDATGRSTDTGAAILEVSLRPLPAFESEGYPDEHVRIVIQSDCRVLAFPRGTSGRPFLHRNLWPTTELCLQYDRDDPALKWVPEDGLEPLVTMVHRHLIFEEHWRRTGQWPTEDAPHGHAPTGGAHPIRTAQLREEVDRWARS